MATLNSQLLQSLIVCIIISLLLVPQVVLSAELLLESRGIDDNGFLKIDVFANTNQKNPFNAAGAVILFTSDIFSIHKIDIKDSIFDIWTKKPKVTDEGKIEFGGGTTGRGGFIFKGKLFEISANLKDFGSGSFSFDDASVLAHDGVGTNILENVNEVFFRHDEAIPEAYDTNGDYKVSIQELSIGLVTDT